MTAVTPQRLIVWVGPPGPDSGCQGALRTSGFTTQVATLSRVRPEGAWALVLPVGGETGVPNAASALSAIRAGLDCGVNTVILGAGAGRLKEALRERELSFADELPDGNPDDRQGFADIPLGGAELRRCAASPLDLLLALERPSGLGPENADVELTGSPDLENDPAIVSLLRRSFGEVRSCNIRALRGGRLAQAVLSVTPLTGEGGVRPLPFVAKVGSRREIIREARRFETRVRDYVPFGNRPNFLQGRSFVLACRGVLVGQFAERTVSLDSAIRSGAGVGAIHQLFSTVLHRWWSNAFHAGSPKGGDLYSAGLRRWFNSGEDGRDACVQYHCELARRELGEEMMPPAELRRRLGAQGFAYWHGGIHGDLNCGNVLVRGDVPFLIDFSHCTDGPILADPAWLEVNLVFGWDWASSERPYEVDQRRREEWGKVVDALYDPDALRAPLPPHSGEDFSDEMHRLCRAVDAIRRHANVVSASRDDYRIVLAAALVRFGSRRDPVRGDGVADRFLRLAQRVWPGACEAEAEPTVEASAQAERRSLRAAVAYAAAARICAEL